MGTEVMRPYLDALDAHHPDSQRFDCMAAGLSPTRAAMAARETMRVPAAPPCPAH